MRPLILAACALALIACAFLIATGHEAEASNRLTVSIIPNPPVAGESLTMVINGGTPPFTIFVGGTQPPAAPWVVTQMTTDLRDIVLPLPASSGGATLDVDVSDSGQPQQQDSATCSVMNAPPGG